MKRRQLKFVICPVVIVLTLTWIAFSAFNDNKAYFQTVSELYASEGSFEGKRLRVMGEVVPGSIVRGKDSVDFIIIESDQTLKVRYMGTSPIPDTFRDYAEAVVDGHYAGDGVFNGTKLQAKCASKYEREVEAGVIPPVT